MKKNLILLCLFLAAAGFLIFAAWMQGGEAGDVEAVIKDVEPFAYICLPHTGPYTEIENVISRIFHAFNQQGITPMGGILGVFHNAPGEVSDDELKNCVDDASVPQPSAGG